MEKMGWIQKQKHGKLPFERISLLLGKLIQVEPQITLSNVIFLTRHLYTSISLDLGFLLSIFNFDSWSLTHLEKPSLPLILCVLLQEAVLLWLKMNVLIFNTHPSISLVCYSRSYSRKL